MYQITITKADNGYVLRYYDEETEQERLISVEDPANGDEAITTQKMLWEVMEHFGLFGNKHDPVRVKIVLEGIDGKIIKED